MWSVYILFTLARSKGAFLKTCIRKDVCCSPSNVGTVDEFLEQAYLKTRGPSKFHLLKNPGRLIWNLGIHPWKRKIIFQTIIFRFYVNLPGCINPDQVTILSPSYPLHVCVWISLISPSTFGSSLIWHIWLKYTHILKMPFMVSICQCPTNLVKALKKIQNTTWYEAGNAVDSSEIGRTTLDV